MAVPVRMVLMPSEEGPLPLRKRPWRIRELNGIMSDYDPASEVRASRPPRAAEKSFGQRDLECARGQRNIDRQRRAFDVTIGPVVRRARGGKASCPPERIQQQPPRSGSRRSRCQPGRRVLDPAGHVDRSGRDCQGLRNR